jgi:hypothetical protein
MHVNPAVKAIQRLCDDGKAPIEISLALGLPYRTVQGIIRRRGFQLNTRDARLAALTEQQRRDVLTLIDAGGYGMEQAIAKATAPKVKISAKVRA